MVFKEDIVKWFKQLSSYKRIDVMCSLLNMCLPFELRYLGTCLEDLGKRDFKELRDAENRANNVTELADSLVLSDKRTQGKIALYLSLLHSCNYACANTLYKVLANFDVSEISTLVNNTSDDNPLEELLLVYTLAMNHPAFTFEQKSVFVNIFLKLQEEESKWFASKHPPVGMSLVYVKPPIQACIPPCQGSEDQQDIVLPCSTITLPPGHTAGPDMSKARTALPPALGFPPGLSLAHDLQGTSYMQVAFPTPVPGGHQSLPSIPWHPAVVMCGALPIASEEAAPYPSSPHISRQSSPSQSGSPRSGSPSRTTNSFAKSQSNNVARTARGRRNCTENCYLPTSKNPVNHKGNTDPVDPLRETLGKEMPSYLSNLQNYSIDELQCMGDEELKKLGLPTGAIHQLRSIVNKLHTTNGLSPLDKREHRRKVDSSDPEQGADRRAPALLPHQQLITAPGMGVTCITVPVTTAPSSRHTLMQTQQFLQINNNLRNLRLEQTDYGRHCSNSSSASDSSSASHSPPDTPSMPSATPHWERGSREHRSPGTDERERRVPEPSEKLHEEAPTPIVPAQATRPRLPGGLARGKVNPPGMPTLPRSRGPAVSEGAGHKSLPGCRTAVNGSQTTMPPRPGHEDRKLFMVPASEVAHVSTSQAPGVPQYSIANNPPPRPGEANVPYTAFLQHFPGLRTTTTAGTSIFPAFHHPGGYIRPSYPFTHNGDLVYQYHGPQTPPPPPPTTFVPPVFSAAVPPPKVSCYNCGSSSHLATDCKEATMEEMTKPGQYHIDYLPYQKSGECSSEK